MNTHTRVDVALGERSYPILIGAGLLGHPAHWRPLLAGRQVLVVSNPTVAALYLDKVLAALTDASVTTHIVQDGEQYKSLDSASAIFEALAGAGANRDAAIIALGGGVIGDLAGFAAACWMRGIAFAQLPTTLLAMVDSSVGGKTAVNLSSGKNLVGAFHQPGFVVIDTDTLSTLPDREFRAGLAEVVKYGAIGDAGFFDALDANAAALAGRDTSTIVDAIATSCRHKARVVASDERETGDRALLNFGHTFAHALEAEAGYGELLHGEAVAIGMVLAARLSTRLGRADGSDADRLTALLERLALPTQAPKHLDTSRLIERMRLDKKNAGGRLRLILWRRIGDAEIVPGIDEGDIAAVLDA